MCVVHLTNHLTSFLLHSHTWSQFNLPFNNLPPALIYLELGSEFNQILTFSPNTVITHLTLGSGFYESFVLPESLTHLRLNDGRWTVTLPPLPNLTHLFIYGRPSYVPINNIPLSVTHLTFGRPTRARVDLSQHLKRTHLAGNFALQGFTFVTPHRISVLPFPHH